MSEASTADLRAKLDELYVLPAARGRYYDALRAVLDLADHFERHYGPSLGSEIRHVLADALGVQRATPPAVPNAHRFDPDERHGGECRRCYLAADHEIHQQRATPPAEHEFVPPHESWKRRDQCGRCRRKAADPIHHQQRGERAERGNNTEGDR